MEPRPHSLGRRRALLFQGFACFAHDQAVQLGLDRLHFITREGHFYRRVHETLFGSSTDGKPTIGTILLDASRQSTFGPSVLVTGDLQRLWNLYPRITPLAFIKSLNLEEESLAPFFNHAGLPLDMPVERPWSDTRFLKVLRDPGFARAMAGQIEEHRDLTKAYFSPILAGRNAVGIVEIGWQGSIQDNLALLFPDIRFHGFYLGLAIAKNPPVANSSKLAFGPDRNRSPADRHLLNAVNVLEFICLAPGGSVMRYERDPAGAVRPIRSHNASEDELIEKFSIPFQQGVIEASSREQAAPLLDSLRDGSLRGRAIAEWSKLLSEPDPALVAAYFALKSNEEFGMGEFRDQAQTPTWGVIALAPFSKKDRSRLIRYLTYSQWAEGMSRRKDLPLLKRWVLYRLMRIAIAVKAFVHGSAVKTASRRQAGDAASYDTVG